MKSIFKKPLEPKDYLLIIDINNPPLCKCGCGQKVMINKANPKYWSYYLFNHHLFINRKLCKCGCGQKVEKSYQTYISNHKHKKESSLCKCGCGKKTILSYSKYYPGHYELQNYKTKNKIIDKLCKCGCGRNVLSLNAQYYPECYSMLLHNNGINSIDYSKTPLCKCGCGQKVTWRGSYKSGYWNNYLLGHNQKTKEEREKKRILMTNQYCPNIGKIEFEIFSKLQEVCLYKIYCLEDQRTVSGYFIDGYISELNLVIEIDEQYHNGKESKVKDPVREENIKKELNCIFYRIKLKTWCESSEIVLKEFIELINTLRVTKNL